MAEALRVLHIIPAAFDYFDDITKNAFGVVDELNQYDGIAVDAFTLQYTNTTQRERMRRVRQSAGRQHYVGAVSAANANEDFSAYRLINLHTPFLGAAGRILRWKKEHPSTPLVITHHRPFFVTDLMSCFIKWYNNYYLTKLFKQADLITVLPTGVASGARILRYLGTNQEPIRLADTVSDDLTPMSPLNLVEVARRLLEFYNYLI